MKFVKTLITTRFRTFRSWFETSVLFAWVLVFQDELNPFQTTVREFMPNVFSQWSTENSDQKLVNKIACS
jgi:hypothetical protein